MLKMIPIPNTMFIRLLLLASFFFGTPASNAAFLQNMPSGAKNYFLRDLSPDQSPKHEDSCRVCGHKTQKSVSGVAEEYIPPTNPSVTNRQVWNWFSDGLLRSVENTTTNTATYYLWNAQKRLEGVAFTDGTSTAYAYLPGSDLRLSSVNRSGTATLFHWDGVQLREVLNPKEGSGANSPPQAQGGRAANLPTDSNPTQTITSAYLTGLLGTWDEILTVSIPDGENPENLLLFLQNHQSSVVGTLQTSNPLVSRQFFNYLAYGEPKGTSPESLPLAGIGYTGRQHDDTGLMYYRGRYRDSCTGTFIQEDKMRDGWNWYGYASDPVNMVDPSGQIIQLLPTAIAGGIIGGAVNAGIAAWDGKNSKEITDAFFSGATGGLTGSFVASITGGAGYFISGALGGVTGTVAMKGVEKGSVGIEDAPAIAVSAMTGGLLNGIGGFRLDYTAGEEVFRNQVNGLTKKLLEKNAPFPSGWVREHKKIMSTSTRIKELLVETLIEDPINVAAFAAGLPITNAIVDAVAFKSYLFIERLCSK